MNPRNVLLLSFDPRAAGYSNDKAEQMFGNLLERVRTLPNVESAGLADTMPLSFVPNSAGVSRPGQDTHLVADIYGVTSQYFQTLGIELVRGKDFVGGRRTGLPPAVVNEALAAGIFHGDDPIGRVVNWEGVPHEVIAIARNVKSRTPTEVAPPQIYVSLESEYRYFWGLSGVVLGVRTVGNPAVLIDSVRLQMRDLDSTIPVYDVETMKDHVGRALLVQRLCGALFGIFGAVALALAIALGLSLIVALLMTPLFCMLFIRQGLKGDHGSVGAIVHGFSRFDDTVRVAGVILNNVPAFELPGAVRFNDAISQGRSSFHTPC